MNLFQKSVAENCPSKVGDETKCVHVATCAATCTAHTNHFVYMKDREGEKAVLLNSFRTPQNEATRLDYVPERVYTEN